MTQKQFGRRRFLGSAAAGVIGVVGGVAAIDTASASSGISGTVSVRSSKGDWEYWVGLANPRPDGPMVEKQSEANGHDEVLLGRSAHGHVYEGGVDKYSFDDQITKITAHHKGTGASLVMNIGEDSLDRRKMAMYEDSGNSHFYYYFSVDNADVDGNPYYSAIEKGYRADDNDSVSGNFASGFINADKSDGYYIVGHIENYVVYAPGSTDEGLSVYFHKD